MLVGLKIATCSVNSVARDLVSDVLSLSMTVTSRLIAHNRSYIPYQMILRHVEYLFLEIELTVFTAESTSEHLPCLAKQPSISMPLYSFYPDEKGHS